MHARSLHLKIVLSCYGTHLSWTVIQTGFDQNDSIRLRKNTKQLIVVCSIATRNIHLHKSLLLHSSNSEISEFNVHFISLRSSYQYHVVTNLLNQRDSKSNSWRRSNKFVISVYSSTARTQVLAIGLADKRLGIYTAAVRGRIRGR
jgi:hypothetical protein